MKNITTGIWTTTKNKPWYQCKTIWVGIAALVAAAGGYFTGEMDLQIAIQTAITGLTGIFLRQGLKG